MPAQDPVAARTNIYLVSSGYAVDILPGDVVVMTTSAASSSVRRRTGSTTTDFGAVVGVAASKVLGGDGSTGANVRLLTTQTLLVYDDPQTVFIGCDTTSGLIGGGGLVGKSMAVCSSGVVGSTGPNTVLGRSVMALSPVTASSGGSNGFVFRVIGLAPFETAYSTVSSGTASSAGEVRKFLCVPDSWIGSAIGVGLVTT